MTTYYTAKDIEKLAAAGVRQLELDPTAVLTDFARETAQQLGIVLVKKGWQSQPATQSVSANAPTKFSSKYNKPSGCQHAAGTHVATQSRTSVPAQAGDGTSENTMNRLIDLMGKVLKRGE